MITRPGSHFTWLQYCVNSGKKSVAQNATIGKLTEGKKNAEEHAARRGEGRTAQPIAT